jgi:hypothetical protein
VQSHPSTIAAGRRSPIRYVLLGGLALGTLDLAFAMSYWGISRGVSPVRVLQSVSRGVLGTASFQGGAGTAVLGAVLHYFIATCMVLAYYLVSRGAPALTRRPIAYGLPYGLLLFLIMNLVVLPLSAAGPPGFNNVPWIALSIIMHAVFGVICAIAAQFASMNNHSTR